MRLSPSNVEADKNLKKLKLEDQWPWGRQIHITSTHCLLSLKPVCCRLDTVGWCWSNSWQLLSACSHWLPTAFYMERPLARRCYLISSSFIKDAAVEKPILRDHRGPSWTFTSIKNEDQTWSVDWLDLQLLLRLLISAFSFLFKARGEPGIKGVFTVHACRAAEYKLCTSSPLFNTQTDVHVILEPT